MKNLKRSLLSIGVAAAALASVVPAHAASVSVTLKITIGEPVASAPYKSCVVPVPQGANGVTMLDAAVKTGCISSYQVDKESFGDFLIAIDQLRGAHEAMDLSYWRTTLNGAMTDTGIDGFQAQNGQVYGFSYTTWLTCFAPIGC